MKTTPYTSTEYQQLGRDMTEFAEILYRLRSLVSRSYGPNSKLTRAVATAHEVFPALKWSLQELATAQLPIKDIIDAFSAGLPADYWPPQELPGCTKQETAIITKALEQRLLADKRTPLSVIELKAVAQVLYHIDAALFQIIEKTDALDPKGHTAAKALPIPWLTIGDAFIAVSKELLRVRDGQ
ncbi:MAG: hypothetical protein GX087_11360 [Desulfobulbaceae bacterium]|nr:hypothetical protein [Desulfobulbaceae bacterium]